MKPPIEYRFRRIPLIERDKPRQKAMNEFARAALDKISSEAGGFTRQDIEAGFALVLKHKRAIKSAQMRRYRARKKDKRP